MEGEGVSTGVMGAPSSGAGTSSIGSGPVGGGFESLGTGAMPVGNGSMDLGSPVSIFEAPVPVSELGAERSSRVGEFPAVPDEIAAVESGIIDAVRMEGTPEAGFQFLSDVSVIDENISPVPTDETIAQSEPAVDLPQTETFSRKGEDLPMLTQGQEIVHRFLRNNPEMLTSIGQILNLSSDEYALFIKSLNKALEEEQKNKEENKMSKLEIALLAFLLMVQLAASAVEKGAKESTRQ